MAVLRDYLDIDMDEFVPSEANELFIPRDILSDSSLFSLFESEEGSGFTRTADFLEERNDPTLHDQMRTNWHFVDADEEKTLEANIFSIFYIGDSYKIKDHITNSVYKHQEMSEDSRVFLNEFLLVNYALSVGNEPDIPDEVRASLMISFIKNCFFHSWNKYAFLQQINMDPNPEGYRTFLELLRMTDEDGNELFSPMDIVYCYFSSEYEELTAIPESEIFCYDAMSRSTILDTICDERSYMVKEELKRLDKRIKDRFKAMAVESDQAAPDTAREIESIKTFLNEWSAERIYDYLDGCLIKQHKAKQYVSTFIYEHFRKILYPNDSDERTSLCLIGPPGVGKTASFLAAKYICPEGMVEIFDASAITQRGFQGASLEQYIKWLLRTNRAMQYGLLIADEMDKLCIPCHSSDGDDVSRSIQSSFYTLIDRGETVDSDSKRLNTGYMEMAFCGAFVGLDIREKPQIGFSSDSQLADDDYLITDKIIKFGMTQELARRITNFVTLEPLSADDYYALLNSKDTGACEKLSAFYQRTYGISVNVSDGGKRLIAQMAYDAKLGVTGMRSILEGSVKNRLFREFQEKTGTITITEDDFKKSQSRRAF